MFKSALIFRQGSSQSTGEVTSETANVEAENMETETSTENQEPSSDASKMDTNEGETQDGDKTAAATAQSNQPKQTVKAVDLNVESKTTSFTQQQILELTEREVSFQAIDGKISNCKPVVLCLGWFPFGR